MSETDTRLPLEELIKTPEFQRLTGKQKLWVNSYIQGGSEDGNYDAVFATRVAYKCKSQETARVMSYSILRNIHIVEVLNRHFNRAPIAEFIETLDRAIRNKHLTPSQLGALELKAKVLGVGFKMPAVSPNESATEKSERKPRGKKKVEPPAKPPKKYSMFE